MFSPTKFTGKSIPNNQEIITWTSAPCPASLKQLGNQLKSFREVREGGLLKCLWKWSLTTNSFSAVSRNCKSKHLTNTHSQKLNQERKQPHHSLFFSNMQTLSTRGCSSRTSAGPMLPQTAGRLASCQRSHKSNTSSDHRTQIQFQSSIPSVSSSP